MLKCLHCESLNKDTNAVCVQCGAPLGRAKQFGVVRQEAQLVVANLETYVQGIDISAWNGTMDFSITEKLVHYCIMRAGWGDTGKDIRIDTYRNQIVLTKLVYGLYWYCKVGLDWRKHAQSFYNIWKEAPGVLRPVFDFEETTLSAAQTTTWIYNLMQEFQMLSGGVKPDIYTSPGFWNSHTVANNWSYLYLLWDAHWTLMQQPILPRGWNTWKHWQWSADGNRLGRIYGSLDGDADMDLDRYNGTLEQFNQEYHTNLLPLEPPAPIILPDPIIPQKYVFSTCNLNMRAQPAVNSTDIGTLHSGDDVPVVETHGEWYKIMGWIFAPFTRPKT